MRSIILAAAAAATLSFAGAGAEAMPAGVVVGASAPEVTLVAGGCGPGFRPGPYGGCRPFGAVVVRPYAVVRPYRPYAYYRPYARCGVRVGPLAVRGAC